MINKLFEEINRFKLLSGYDTNKTLSEQIEILTEQDKKWKVRYYNNEPIATVGPNQEFIPSQKGIELGLGDLSKFDNFYRAEIQSGNEGNFYSFPYDKRTHSQFFVNQQSQDGQGRVQQQSKLNTNTPPLKGDKTKVGTSNLNGTNGIAKFTNGSLFTGFAPNTTLFLGKLEILESFKVPYGAVPITIPKTKVTPPEYKSVPISFGEATMSDPFVIGKSDLKSEAKNQLDDYVRSVLLFKTNFGDEAYQKYVEFLTSKKPIAVNGYASRDSDPNKVYRSGKTAEQTDLELSKSRAEVIANYITSRLPELKGVLLGVGNGQTTQFGGEESGWPAPDKTKYAVNRRFVIDIPDFSYDKKVMVTPEITTNYEEQGMDTSGVRPQVKDDRGQVIRMGTKNTEYKSVETEFASQKEIDLANQVYETDLGKLIPELTGQKIQHFKDPNGYFIISKEQLKSIEKYIPIIDGPYINGVSNPIVTLTNKSLSLEANGVTYMWKGWQKPTASLNDGNNTQLITSYKLVAMKYKDSSAGRLITPSGYLLGRVAFGIFIQNLE